MAMYISLIRWTGKGIENVKNSPDRLAAAKKAFKAAGAEMKAFYMVMGQYDMVVITEAPDDETASRAALTVGATGSIRTETFRAFTEDEYKKIIGALS